MSMLTENNLAALQNLSKPTQAMEELFIIRTYQHIKLVKNNLLNMTGFFGLSESALLKAAEQHDQSKYLEPERSAYIWMTWMYFCKNNQIDFSYSPQVAEIVSQGWRRHITTNAHHPEYHANLEKMDILAIVEMVSDWTAIHQENNQNLCVSCLGWAEGNLENKWSFSEAKQRQIKEVIQELDKRNKALENDRSYDAIIQ